MRQQTLRRMVGIGVPLLAGLAVGVWWLTRPPLDAALRAQLSGRGKVVALGPADWLALAPEHAEMIAPEAVPALGEALAGSDGARLARQMDAAGVGALLVQPDDPGTAGAALRGSAGSHSTDVGHAGAREPALGDRLRAFAHVPGLQGRYLTPEAALYVRDPLDGLTPALGEALAVVARGILGGAEPPRVTSFPEPLRRVGNVEVMVMLERGGQPKLWRSARGSSLARALLTAAVVARQRWSEREQAMGGPLDRALPGLDVRVSVLREDGTLGDRSAAFLERAVTSAHGVAYEGKGHWRYLLPDATRTSGRGSALVAYEKLFRDSGLPEDALGRPDLRFYRLVVIDLATSPAASAAQDPLEALDAQRSGGATSSSGVAEASPDASLSAR